MQRYFIKLSLASLLVSLMPVFSAPALALSPAQYAAAQAEVNVLGATTYAPVVLYNASNLTLSVTPFQFDQVSQKWNYSVNWVRQAGRNGSIYINGNLFSAQAWGTWQLNTGFSLDPSTNYKITFYSLPNGKGVKIVNKYFKTLPASAANNDTTICLPNSDCGNPPAPTIVPFPTVPAPTPMPTPVSTSGAPMLFQLTPSSGPVGTTVIISGSGFGPAGNTVEFGSNIIINSLFSSDGSTLSFAVPKQTMPCGTTVAVCNFLPALIAPGNYPVTVVNANGTSNSLIFTVNCLPTYDCPTPTPTPTPIIYTTPVPTPSPITLVTPTPTPIVMVNNCQGTTNTSGQCLARPALSSLNPSSGYIGSSVIVNGNGFTPNGNTVMFGSGASISNLSSIANSLNFTVPSYNNTPCGITTTAPCTLMATVITPGNYSVTVVNANGVSNSLTFTVNCSSGACTSLTPTPTPIITPTPTPIPPVTPTPTPVTVITNCQGTTNSSGQCLATLVLNYLSPAYGGVGTQVTIYGTGFAPSGNTVQFGSGVTISNLSSTNGSSLSFTVPSQTTPCAGLSIPCGRMAALIIPGSYSVFVTNGTGTSNALTFVVSQ